MEFQDLTVKHVPFITSYLSAELEKDIYVVGVERTEKIGSDIKHSHFKDTIRIFTDVNEAHFYHLELQRSIENIPE